MHWSTIRKVLRTLYSLGNRHRHRVPVFLQLTSVDCGAASLAMVASYWGIKVSVAECRARLPLGRDGLSARSIMQGAQTIGLKCRAYSLKPADLAFLELPAILHWDFNHFLVLEEVGDKAVTLVDPAIGRRRIEISDVQRHFTGVALTFEKIAEGILTDGPSTPYRYLAQYGAYLLSSPSHRLLCGQLALSSIGLSCLSLAAPVLTGFLVDRVIPEGQISPLVILGTLFAITNILSSVLTYLRGRLLIVLRQRFDTTLVSTFFEHLLSLKYHFFQIRSTGDLMLRLNSNIVLRDLFSNHLVAMLLDVVLLVSCLCALWSTSPELLGGLFLLLLVQAGLGYLGTARSRAAVRSELEAAAAEQSFTLETLRGITCIKSSALEGEVFTIWSSYFARHLNACLERNRIVLQFETLTSSFRRIIPNALLLYGGAQVIGGEATLGSVLAVQALASNALSPVNSIVSSMQQLAVAAVHIERIADVVTSEPEVKTTDQRGSVLSVPTIRFCNVTFCYPGAKEPALSNVSFTVRPGEQIAIVGPTGCGKSTILKLLVGLYVPTDGTILVDDIPLARINLLQLRRAVGSVMQDGYIFGGSIRSNISMGAPGMSMEAIESAAKTACLHDEIERMPMGYETILTEGGTNLSGGQRQRLSLCRAVATSPSMLLLDEATSHVDTVTEARLVLCLRRRACTQVIVAHRLSTIRNADLILVMKHGEIVESGTHDELLRVQQLYHELWGRQAIENKPISLSAIERETEVA